jgi:hypothetical protein
VNDHKRTEYVISHCDQLDERKEREKGKADLNDLVQERHRGQQSDLELLLRLDPVLLRCNEVEEELSSVRKLM